ncbi:uncharacterized protein LOC144039751 [Vanacampus margaritifer]
MVIYKSPGFCAGFPTDSRPHCSDAVLRSSFSTCSYSRRPSGCDAAQSSLGGNSASTVQPSWNEKESTRFLQEKLPGKTGRSERRTIRRILRRVATNDVLSEYSLRGRKSKKPFQDLTLCEIIIAACRKNFVSQTEAQFEAAIGLALKSAPHRQ